MKKSYQNDVFDRLQLPTRTKLMPQNSLVENVVEDSIGIKQKKEDGENISKEKDIKISQDNDLFDEIRLIKMEHQCSDMGEEDDKEEEKNRSPNEGRRKPMSMLEVPSINIGHFSKGTQLNLPEPLRTTKQEEDGFEEKEADEEQAINAKDVLSYAWQIAKGMVRIFSIRCLEHIVNIYYLVVTNWRH